MAAEIVVVVENQNARLVSHLLAIKIRRGQAADAAAHDDQVERLFVFCGLVPLLPVTQGVSRFPRAVVAAAHASLCGWIIAGLLFWSILGLGRVEHFAKNRTRGYQRRSNGNANPIQKISPSDAALHSQLSISFPVAHACLRYECGRPCSKQQRKF